MTDYPIPASAIEAAAEAQFEHDGWTRAWDDPAAEDMRKLWRESAEATLRAAFDELDIHTVQCVGGGWYLRSRVFQEDS